MPLQIKLENGEPTSIELDGKPIFVQSMDIEFRPCERAVIKMCVYVHPVGGHEMEDMCFYAVSKEELDQHVLIWAKLQKAIAECKVFEGTPEFDALRTYLES